MDAGPSCSYVRIITDQKEEHKKHALYLALLLLIISGYVVWLATIWRDLPGFTGSGSARGSSKRQRQQGKNGDSISGGCRNSRHNATPKEDHDDTPSSKTEGLTARQPLRPIVPPGSEW